MILRAASGAVRCDPTERGLRNLSSASHWYQSPRTYRQGWCASANVRFDKHEEMRFVSVTRISRKKKQTLFVASHCLCTLIDFAVSTACTITCKTPKRPAGDHEKPSCQQQPSIQCQEEVHTELKLCHKKRCPYPVECWQDLELDECTSVLQR